MKANKLILNIEKTNYILFGTQTTIEHNLKLYYRNKEINRVSNTKFLGVFVDEKLSWNNHIDNLCKTLSKNIGILYRLQFLPQNVLTFLYHSLVSSHVNYCNIVWGFTTKKNIERIHKLQKRGIRIITHSPFVSSSVPLFLRKFYLLVTWYLCKPHYSCLDYVTTFYLKYLTIILLWIVPSIITKQEMPKIFIPHWIAF